MWMHVGLLEERDASLKNGPIAPGSVVHLSLPLLVLDALLYQELGSVDAVLRPCHRHNPVSGSRAVHAFLADLDVGPTVLLDLHYMAASRTKDSPHEGLVHLDVDLGHRLFETWSKGQRVAGGGEAEGVVVDGEGQGGGGEWQAWQSRGRRWAEV